MITTLRGHAPQVSYIRHAKCIGSPSTLRRYHRFNPKFVVARRSYSTENDHAPALDNGSNAPADVQLKDQGYMVIRGGFGDKDEDPGQEARADFVSKARKRKRTPGPRLSQWERLRNFEPEEQEKPTVIKEGPPNTNPPPADLGNVHATYNPPADPSQRTTQEDIVTLYTYTVWERNHEWGYLHRGFEFVDFRAARSFIIEAMQLKDELGAHMHLSNFGRYVYVRLGTPAETYELNQEPRAWSIGDGDVDLGWALPKAAKKYMGKWQMDAAAKPVSDLGYSDSWDKTSRLVVPSKGRWNQLLDLRRPPRKWLTMEYRQLSELNISATEIVTALVNQIAEDLVQPNVGEENMAFPVWCVTEHTLAVSQTEFFCTSTASITKPGEGALQCRETVILHRNFDLEQFHSMKSKEGWALKNDVKDRRHVDSLAQSVTIHWRHSTKHPKRHSSLLNLSSDTVYLKNWGPFLTTELQPLVRRILAREVPEHAEHVGALPDIYSREAILQNYGDASNVVPDENESPQTEETGSNQQGEDQVAGPQDGSKPRNGKMSEDFNNLVNILRERFEKQPSEQEPEDSLGRDPDYMLVRRPSVTSMPAEIRRVAQSEEKELWKRQYFKLRRILNQRRHIQEPRTDDNETTNNLSAGLVNLLSKVSLQSEGYIDWRSRYYELRRSAGSLGLLNRPETNEFMESGSGSGPQREVPAEIHWTPDTGFSNAKRKNLIRRHEALGKYIPGYHDTMREDGHIPEMDEQEHGEALESYQSNEQKHTVFYHWLPGEKLYFNPATVQDNQNQAWRPWNFKHFVTKQARDEMYADSPSAASAPSSLITGTRRLPSDTQPWSEHRNENAPYVRPLEDGKIDYLHWLPGTSFPIDKNGKIRVSSKDEDREKELEKRRQELMDDLPIHRYNLSEDKSKKQPRIRKIPFDLSEHLITKIKHGNMTRQTAMFLFETNTQLKNDKELRNKLRQQTRLKQARSMAASEDDRDIQSDDAHPASQDDRELQWRRRYLEKSLRMARKDEYAAALKRNALDETNAEDRQILDELLSSYRLRHLESESSGDEPSGEGETKSETQSQPQPEEESDAASAHAEEATELDVPFKSVDPAPASQEPSVSAGTEETSSSAEDAAPKPQGPSRGSFGEMESDGGMLNHADAEKLLEEVGISAEKKDDGHGEKEEVNTEKDGETGEGGEKKDKGTETPWSWWK